MGEARRRKLAGTHPQSDPLEDLRRFWCGRQPGPVEEFTAPVGTIAITLDVQGVAPTTAMLDAAKVVDLIPAALAHSQGPLRGFADVRLVDDRGAQIPYLLERRSERLTVDLDLRGAAGGSSTRSLRLRCHSTTCLGRSSR